jgi:MoaA/NifB/PqqE/SkfB family radical SAM enzyme
MKWKMNEKAKRLLNWAKGNKQGPVTIELVPTNRCNFNCPSCWRQNCSKAELEKKFENELSDKRLLSLIDEASKIGVRDIAFVGGGEPLMRDVTFELIKKIKKVGMEGDLVTNGSLLTKEMMETFVKIGWDRIKFSVDGSDAKLQDKLRGVKCFDDIMKNIKTIANLKKKYNKEKPRLIFNTVISKRNYKDLINIVELGHKVGINEILLLPLTVFSDEGKDMKMNLKQAKEFQNIIRKCLPLLKKYNIDSNMKNFIVDVDYLYKTNLMDEVMMQESNKYEIKEKSKKGEKIIQDKKEDTIENFKTVPCFEPWTHITILPDGKIACCFNNYVWETDVTIKDNKLKDLWYGPYFDKFRKEILSRKLSKACATCCIWRLFEVQDIKKEMENSL